MRNMDKAPFAQRFEELLNDLTRDMMAYWWQANTRQLVQTIGSKEAVQKLRPYWEHGGRATAFNLRQMTGITADDAGSIAMLWAFPRIDDRDGLERDQVKVMAGERTSMTTIKGCSVYELGQNDEICQCVCIYGGRACIEELNPEYELEMIRSRSNGDDDCCWIVRRRDDANYDEERNLEMPRPKIVNNMFGHLSMAYLGQFWIDSTNAFIESVGKEKAIGILLPMMRDLGRKFGVRLMEELDMELDRFDLLQKIVEKIDDSIQMELNTSLQSLDMVEKEVTYCPFSNAPPEICEQFESFINGICDSVAPSYELHYCKKMTIGDKTCHWVVKRKTTGTNEISHQSETGSQGALDILKKRLASGEISKDEYKELRDLLLEQ